MNKIDAELSSILDQCVKCGACLGACPTYRLHANEAQSPRGRLELMRLSPLDQSGADAIESCLACGRCQRSCPIQVDYLRALDLYRADRASSAGFTGWLLAHPRVFSLITRIATWLPLWLARGLPARFALPGLIRTARRAHPISSHPTAPGLAIWTGCTGLAIEGAAINAFQSLAGIAGSPATAIQAQCCGTLHRHRGDTTSADDLAQASGALIRQAAPTALVTLTTGCHAKVRAIAQTLHVPTIDALVWLSRHRFSFRRATTAVALHHPCTSEPEQRQALRSLLEQVPGLIVRELDRHSGCCGAAGDHFLRHAESARAHRQLLFQDWQSGAETILLSANIGCRLHLNGLPEWRVMHPLEFLHQQLDET